MVSRSLEDGFCDICLKRDFPAPTLPMHPATTRLANKGLQALQTGGKLSFQSQKGQIRWSSAFKRSSRATPAPSPKGRVAGIVLVASVSAFALGFGTNRSIYINKIQEYSREDKFKAPKYATAKEMEIVCGISWVRDGNVANSRLGHPRNSTRDFRGDDHHR